MSAFDFKVAAPDLLKVTEAVDQHIGAAAYRAMDRATIDLKDDLGAQMIQAGFSPRFAKAWQREVYSSADRKSLNPAGYVRSKAPDIIDAFSRGATIKPVNGGRYLWIPTKFVPKARRRVMRDGRVVAGGAMAPEEVEDLFGDFIFKVEKGKGLTAFVRAIRARNGKGERSSTPRRRAQGREERLIPMFNLRRTVRMPKAIDLQVSAERGAASFARHFDAELAKS